MSGETMGHAALEAEGLDDWRILFSALHARFLTGDFATGLHLVDAIGAEAEAMGHHPDLDLRYPHLNVRLTSHDKHGVTERDVRLARRISELAAAEDVAADPSVVAVLEIALDTPDHAVIKPFWAAVLGLQDSPTEDVELVDPDGALPTLWFQPTDPHQEPRQRFHLDLRVSPETAAGRIAAAVAAGGVLVSDARAPSFWVLADAEGNRVCITTCQGRD